jgi:acetyl-CoA carboxylase biotin carboxylase subunit
MKIKKVLIANRGEIAVRIIRASKELGITSAAVYSEADANALHVKLADEAFCIGPAAASESYLRADKILQVAKEINADAIHPGYGFLSENADFISKCEEAGLIFIGPSADAVVLMGEKTAARTLMKKNNVPIVPGTTEPIEDMDELRKIADEIGYPIMLKAAAGGGGKGMRRISAPEELIENYNRAKSEAIKAFGNGAIYLEKFIENPKHIEVQIIADKHGNYRHVFERECSVQRRHQKVVEESPSASVTPEVRSRITEAAINAAKACNYYNAGTIEFLMDTDKNFYFLEMNTRLQVEHPVTELISGLDLVKEQFRIAEGEKISFEQDELILNGSALECRVYAEDVTNNYAPSIGKVELHRLPSGPGVRVDTGIETGSEVSVYYDPMLSKVVTWGRNRTEAIGRMLNVLKEYKIAGVKTNIPLFKWILKHPKFVDGTFDINFLDVELAPLMPDKWMEDFEDLDDVVSLIASYLRKKERMLKVTPNQISAENKWVESDG